MKPRIAFTAQFWGNGAVVCHAVEDRPGPAVEQQFGEFKTWTQAHNFATKLNEGLDLDPLEVREIVTSSLLATAYIVQETVNSLPAGTESAVVTETRTAQLRFILSEVALAMTVCRSASLLSGAPVLRMLLHARNALIHSTQFLRSFKGDDRERKRLAAETRALRTALQRARSTPAFRAWISPPIGPNQPTPSAS